jgi:hypothetical protein
MRSVARTLVSGLEYEIFDTVVLIEGRSGLEKDFDTRDTVGCMAATISLDLEVRIEGAMEYK